MKVPVIFELFACEHSSIKFKSTNVFKSYVINDYEFSIGLPDLESKPDCGRTPLLEEVIFEVVTIPRGIDSEELVEFNLNTNRVTVKHCINLKMVDQRLSVSVKAVSEGYPLRVDYIFSYLSGGP